MQPRYFLIITTILCAHFSSAGVRYAVRDLGPTQPLRINQGGAIAGPESGSNASFEWDRRWGATRLDGFSYGQSEALDISDNGSVVGWGFDELNRVRPFIWDHQRGFRDALWQFDHQGQACGINASGQMCGYYWPVGDPNHAFIAESDGAWRELPHLDGHAWAEAWRINNVGQVAGYSGDGVSGFFSGVIWDKGGLPHDVGNLPGQWQIWINDLNDSGWICGDTFGSLGNPAYIQDADGNFIPLFDPFLQGGQMSAGGLNDRNDCVGFATISHGNSVGFVRFARDGVIRDLNTMLAPGNAGVHIEIAYDINNRGQICAWGTLNGEANHGFILTPTPPRPIWRGGLHRK